MKTTIFAIVAVIFLSTGAFSQQKSMKSMESSVNSGVNSQDNTGINFLNRVYKLYSISVSSTHTGNQWTTHLTWTASGETQITGYQIERTRSTSLGDWVVVASVQGSNSNNMITRNFNETFTISSPFTVFYRLKIHYVRGAVQYSQVVYVTIG